MWRREIGAGWSAFAIVGDYAVTQEQRGENELVTCYRVQTGEPVWTHADEARFDPADAVGGLGDIGPRATPTIHGDRIFTQGGTGIVNCLDASTGHVLWSHDTAAEFGATVTLWGKAGSPLVVDDMVVISVGAPTGESPARPLQRPGSRRDEPYNSSLVAFDIDTGAVRWPAGQRQASYASPVLATLGRRAADHRRQRKLGHGPPRQRRQGAVGIPVVRRARSRCILLAAGAARRRPVVSLEGLRRRLVAAGDQARCGGQLAAEPLWQPPIKKRDEDQIQQRRAARRISSTAWTTCCSNASSWKPAP